MRPLLVRTATTVLPALGPSRPEDRLLLSRHHLSSSHPGFLPGSVGAVIEISVTGMLHALLLDAGGAGVVLVDVANERLNFARSAGIPKTVNPKEIDLEKYISDVTSGEYADVVVDAVGNQFGACLGIVARGGMISLFGVNTHATPHIPQYQITRKEVTVVGSFVGRNKFPRSIAVLESGVLDIAGLISHEVGITGIPRAIQDAREGKAMKILVRPEA
jgi:threonine dehydrogenase-like Zn-dependent dehydrogenase